jgi:hypothetical protein
MPFVALGSNTILGPLKGLGKLVGNDILKDLAFMHVTAAPVSNMREKVLLFISTFNLGLILSP